MSDDIALCCIGRGENLYAVEFVEWYKKLGFSKIFIYDNNFGDEEHFEDVLDDYIKDGFVEIMNFRDKVKAQMQAYNDCYARHKNDYVWFLYVDFDEFLVLPQHGSIKDFVKDFPNDCQTILINWLIMTDNNQIHYEPKPLNERFTEVMDVMKKLQYNFPDDMHVKSLIRGGMDRINFCGNPHTVDDALVAYTSYGQRCENRPWQPMNFDKAYLKHFTTKSLQEWIEGKLKKGTADRPYNVFQQTYADRYFRINEVTEDKINYLKAIGAILEPSEPQTA